MNTLSRIVDRFCAETDTSMSTLALQAGVPRKTLYRLLAGEVNDIRKIEKVLTILGYKIVITPIKKASTKPKK